jgi:hypothetical protein
MMFCYQGDTTRSSLGSRRQLTDDRLILAKDLTEFTRREPDIGASRIIGAGYDNTAANGEPVVSKVSR